ncbi:lonely Cys domain-containing protein [Streptomyces griseorubiginosus]|uniref:lonely Cys domain-containing protein n=1 Tax=Streptomyces griseorubiginosus TaxID=67304 RepID=UPI001AD67D6E|nr:lonely Cys domain-containing protein [Streptomyces griseorubiginosus]MBO4257591.1 lonely Cys domain-containing protein [Streptomyces griseorubiginosus]
MSASSRGHPSRRTTGRQFTPQVLAPIPENTTLHLSPDTALTTSSPAQTSPTTAQTTSSAAQTSSNSAPATSDSAQAPSSTPRPVWIGQDLDERRPPRLDNDLPPPSERGGEVRFSDGTRMPVYMGRIGSVLRNLSDGVLRRSFTFGQSDRALRGVDLVVARLDDRLGTSGNRPKRGRAPEPELLSEVRRRLTRKPQGFFGDGQRFAYTTAEGKHRVLHVTTRPYGHWERFAFGYANPVKIDAMQRFTTTNGRTGVHSTSGALVTSVPLGPAKGPVKPFGRLWARLAWNKRVQYPMQNQTMSQIETRTTDGSHAHLDDVWYDFEVTDEMGRPVDETGKTIEPGDTSLDPFSFGFAIRHGLHVRLPDSLTRPQPATARQDFPDTFAFGPQSGYRAVSTEGYGPVAHIRDWAIRQAGVAPDGVAGTQLSDFFSTEGFHRMSRVLNAGQVTTPPLFRDSSARDPIGVFSVRVRSISAHLIDATTAAELRDISQSTVRNEQILGKGRATDVGGMIGPSFQWAGLSAGKLDVRALWGVLNVRYGSSRNRSVATGGSGGIKSAAQAKGDPTGLYLVHKTVTVTAPPGGKAPLPEQRQAGPDGQLGPAKVRKNPPEKWGPRPRTGMFETWSVERLTRTEARRLAGLEQPARQVEAPAAPPYLAENHPPTFGMSRVEEFTFDDGSHTRIIDGRERTFQEHFADQVLKATAQAYPGLVAPLDQLNPDNPRWRNADHFQTVVNNTLEVLNALSHHSLAGNLRTMADTGLRIALVDSGRFGRAIRYVWIGAELTGRRYEGTQRDERLRFSAPGTETLGAAQSGARSSDIGTEAQLSLRSSATNDVGGPKKAGTASVGARYGRRKDTESGHGAAATHEAMSIGTKGSHLYSYNIELTAKRGGYWRLRGLLRGILTLNLLSLQPFVFSEPETTLIGTDPSGHPAPGGEALTGRVLLSIPVEHAPTSVPHGPRHPRHGAVLRATARDARDLALRTRALFRQAADHRPPELERHPHLTLAVVSHSGITKAAEEALNEASGGSWHVTQQGAPAHDSALRAFQNQYMTANFDQTSAPMGWRAFGLWAKGPYTNRTTTLAHRTRIPPETLVALTGAVPVDTETTVGGAGQAVGRTTRTSTVFVGGQVVYLHSHETRPGVTGNYGVVASPYRLDRSRVRTVVRAAVAEINRKDMGRQVLVLGDVNHEIAAASSAVGRGATRRRWIPKWLAGAAGRRVLVEGGWVGHVPEKNAHRLGLLNDGHGDVPMYTGRSWSPQPWLLDNPFGGFPVNSLNTAAVVADFDRKLRSLGLSSADRDTVQRLATGRVVRALGKDMVGAGASAAGRMGRWGSQTAGVWVGDRLVRTRAELIPVKVPRTAGAHPDTGFTGLGHSVELEEHRQGAETVLDGRGRASGATVGLSVTEGVHTTDRTADIIRMAGPTFSQVGSTQQTTGQNTVDGGVRIATATTTQAHGEYVTRYRLRLTAEIVGGPERKPDDLTSGSGDGSSDHSSDLSGDHPGDRSARLKRWAGRQWKRLIGHPVRRITVEGDVGEQVEHFPLSLMRPDPPPGVDESNDPLAPPRLDDPGEPRRVPVPASLGAGGWHDVRHPRDGSVKPFALPEDGFKVRRITGLNNLHAANTLALGSAYDASFSVPDTGTLDEDVLARAMDTPLTRPGTGSAQNLEDGTTNGALTAFYGDTLTPGGYPVPGVDDTGFFGGAQGELSLYSRPDLGAARLLAVTDGMKHEAPKRDLQGGGMSTSRVAATEVSLGGGPIVSSQQTGTNQIAGAPGDSTTDSEALAASGDRLTSVNVKPNTTRSFLFAIPTTWLSIAGVHHHVKDSRVGQAVRGTFGHADRGPQAMETRTTALAWVREDVARDLGLIDDTGFPPKVARAWDAVTKADKAWTEADKEYWNLRRDGQARRQAELDEAERALAQLTARDPNTVPAVRDARNALNRIVQGAADAQPAHDGRADVHDGRLQAAEDRLAEALGAAADEVSAARTARDAAQARLDGLARDVADLRTRAEALAEEYARVRTAADRLTRWHQLNASDEGRIQLAGTPEPDEVVFTPPPAPGKKAPDGTKNSSSATAAGSGTPGTGTRPAYGNPPWDPGAGPDPTLRRFDAAADHRTLTATDPDGHSDVYDLHPVGGRGEGNGFYAAVQLAMGRDPADAHRLADRAALTSRLPAGAALDPQAVFHPRELNSRLGPWFRNDARLHADITAAGGLLPDSVRARLTPVQRERLIRHNLRKGRRWDAATADLAASLTAQTLGVDITVVAEDGSYGYFPGAGPGTTGPLPQVTLYRRGGDYLAALPRTGALAPAPPVPPPTTGTAPGGSQAQAATASGTATPVPPKTTNTATPVPPNTTNTAAPPPKNQAPPLPPSTGREVTADRWRFAVHPIAGDGDCLPNALLTSIRAQHPHLPAAAMDVRRLRDHAADWYMNSADAAPARTRHSAENPLEQLVRTEFRDLGSLLRLLRRKTPPQLNAAQEAHVTADLEDARRRNELRAQATGNDRGLLAELPRSAVRALVPTPQVVDSTQDTTEKERLVAQAQAAALRDEVVRLLDAPENDPQADDLWQRILARLRFRVRPDGAPQDRTQFRTAGYQGVVVDSLRSASMWQTPFYDEVPLVLAGALDIDLVLVRPAGNHGSLIQHLNPGASGPTVYVYYNGYNHYDTLVPLGPASQAATGNPTAQPVRSSKKSKKAPKGRRPDQRTRDRLADFVRQHGASDNYAQRLAAELSDEAVARLRAALDGEPTAAGLSTAPSARSPLTLAGGSHSGNPAPLTDPAPLADPAPAAPSSSALAPSSASVPGSGAGGVRAVRPPSRSGAGRHTSRSRVGFDRRVQDIGPAQLREIEKLAEETVTAGLRDMAAGLPAPRITVTGYGNGSRLRFWDRHAAGRRRAEAVAATLREEIAVQLQVHHRLVRAVAAWRGWDELTSDAFKVDTVDEGRVLGADARFDGVSGREARQQAVVRVERSDLAPVVDRLSELDPQHFGPHMSILETAAAVLHTDDLGNAGGADPGSQSQPPPRYDVEQVPDWLRQLFDLTAEAMAAGRATSVAALGAFHLRKQGLLSDATRLTAPDGTAQGRNWTGEPVQDLDPSTYDEADELGNTKSVPSLWADSPGAPRPYVVAAQNGDHKTVVLSLPDDTRRWRIPTDQLAELLAMDEDLTAHDEDVPVVLASPKAGDMGLKLPRKVAARVGHAVWAHSGDADVRMNTDTGRYRITAEHPVLLPEAPGEWVISEPGDLGPDPEEPADDVLLVAIDGSRFSSSQVRTVTLTDEGRPIGRGTFNDADLLKMWPFFRSLGKVTEFVLYDPVRKELHGTAKPVPWKGVQWKGKKPYFGQWHGQPGTSAVVPTVGPTREIDAPQTGRLLRSRPSVRRLDVDQPIVLIACWLGAARGRKGRTRPNRALAPFVADPLATSAMPVGQGVANENRRTVFAADTLVGNRILSGNQKLELSLFTPPTGDEVDFKKYTPEPADEELDAVVDQAGLDDVPGLGLVQARETALRLVRALRQTFGPDIEDDKDDPDGTYRRLLRGIGALEGMRRRDRNLRHTGEFTLDLLERVTRARLTEQPAPGVRPGPLDPTDVRSALEAASAHVAADPDAVLSDFVPLPSVHRARELLTANGDTDARVRSVLERPPTSRVTAEHRQDALWATVKAVESLENAPDAHALATKALHLKDGDDPRDEVHQRELLWLAAQTAATGRDPYNPAALAAVDLKRRGALGPESKITQSGKVIGRNFTGRRLGYLITDSYVASADGSDQGKEMAPAWSQSHSYFLLPTPGMPADELAELLTHDPHLGGLDPNARVVLLGGEGATTAQALADRRATARNVLLANSDVDLVHDPTLNTETIVVTVPPECLDGPGQDWSLVRPAPLGTGTAQPADEQEPVITYGSATETTDAPPAAPSPQPRPPESVDDDVARDGAGSGEGFTEALADALRRWAPRTASGSRGPGALGDGREPDPQSVRRWLEDRLTEDDVPEDASLPHGLVSIGELSAIGVELTLARQTEATLLGGSLRTADLGLTRLQRFRLLLNRHDRASAGDPYPAVYAAVAARELGVRLVTRHPGGRAAQYGTGNGPVLRLTIAAADRTAGVER